VINAIFVYIAGFFSGVFVALLVAVLLMPDEPEEEATHEDLYQ
jgi:phage shock protein PspC (stress-responsive transcriptional regulator)